jgi:hypothetical protein
MNPNDPTQLSNNIQYNENQASQLKNKSRTDSNMPLFRGRLLRLTHEWLTPTKKKIFMANRHSNSDNFVHLMISLHVSFPSSSLYVRQNCPIIKNKEPIVKCSSLEQKVRHIFERLRNFKFFYEISH